MSKTRITRRDFLYIIGGGIAGWLARDFFIMAENKRELNSISKGANGEMLVNGEAFFPLGVYYLVGQTNNPDTTMSYLFRTKINMVYAYNHQELTTLDMLDRLSEISIREGRSIFAFAGNRNETFRDTAHALELLPLIETHPSMLCWYIDEPVRGLTWNQERTQVVPEQYEPTDLQLFIARNSRLPSFTVFNRSGFLDTSQGLELAVNFLSDTNNLLVGSDTYVSDITEQNRFYLSLARNVNLFTNLIKEDRLPSQFNIAVLSAISDSVLPGGIQIPSDYRHRMGEAITAIINGANGILWWDYPPGCDQQGCGTGENQWEGGYGGGNNAYSCYWQDIVDITDKLAQVEDALLGRTIVAHDYSFSQGQETVEYLIKETESRYVAFVVNTADILLRGGIALKDVNGKILDTREYAYDLDGKAYSIANGRINLQLESGESLILTIEKPSFLSGFLDLF